MTLSLPSPMSVSFSDEPTRFSMPLSVSEPAATVSWAAPCRLRSTVTPVVEPPLKAFANDAVSLPSPPLIDVVGDGALQEVVALAAVQHRRCWCCWR